MILLRLPTRASLFLLTLWLAGSCSSDVVCACDPYIALAGNFQAIRFRFTPNGQATIDALAAGATITLTLSATGSTSGSFVVPASLNNGVATAFDLAGTYQQNDNRVSFSHSADTFIRDVEWTYEASSGRLETTGSAGGVTYDVVLAHR